MKLPTLSEKQVRPGTIVSFQGRPYQVGLVTASGEIQLNSGEGVDLVHLARVRPIKCSRLELNKLRPFLEDPEEYQVIALDRKRALDDLLAQKEWTEPLIRNTAEVLGVSRTSVYRLTSWYLLSGNRVEVLIPGVFKYGVKTRGLAPSVESIIAEGLNRYYKTDKRAALATSYSWITTECKSIPLPVPSLRTVSRRAAGMHPKELAEAREGKKFARDKYLPLPGRAPTGDRPLAKVEIDHTKVNLFCILPNGELVRLTITIVLDLYSRMILGFYLSPDGPSRHAVGMALYAAMSPKEEWLRSIGLEFEWPAAGVPEMCQTDSGKDFAGQYFENVCYGNNIHEVKRPLGRKESGGFIERSMGIAACAMELLPGKTFSNIRDRREYDPKKNAVLTYAEVERAFAIFFNRYHHMPHRGLRGRTPLYIYNKWMEENKETPYPRKPKQAGEDLLISLLPTIDRHIRKGGVDWEKVNYWTPYFAPYIGAKNPLSKDGKYKFHYDPRGVGKLFWIEPRTGFWRIAPTKDPGMGEMSEWEMLAALEKDKRDAKGSLDEEGLHNANKQYFQMVDEANDPSLKQRRADKRAEKGKLTSEKASKGPGATRSQNPIAARSMCGQLDEKDPSSMWEDAVAFSGESI